MSKNTHYKSSSKKFFEGWYLKHQKDDQIIAFIPSVHFDAQSKMHAYLQVITNEGSHFVQFDGLDFIADKKKFEVKAGRNIFSYRGISVDIRLKDFTCKGELSYSPFLKPQKHIMGPFALWPFMECYYEILSLHHSLKGSLIINGQELNFDGGNGYIEKDWGTSFPKSYSWLQLKDDNNNNCAIISVAQIPFLNFVFKGHTAVVCFEGRQYRFAAFNGSKVLEHTKDKIVLKKGAYRLEAEVTATPHHRLKAPDLGIMSRIIFEHPAAIAKVRLYKKEELILEINSSNAGYENCER